MRTLSRFPAARASLAAAVLSLAPSLVGCGSGFLSTKRDGDVTVSYAADAEQNYLMGKKHLDDKSFPEALKYFEFVSARFPYSQYAALSDLGIADTQYTSERYIEAAERYRNFLKLHPTHPKVDYAAFQVGMSYVNQIPSDFFILPRATEKDQTDVKNALALFNEFVAGYPNSTLQPRAKE
jgi:outer membrane protein assembly factor BamD